MRQCRPSQATAAGAAAGGLGRAVRRRLLSSLFLCGLSSAYASTYHGVIQAIRIAATPSGSTRVSVLASSATDCKEGNGADDHWYYFEYSTTGPGAAWLATLLSARVTQASIAIQGTGKCDALGMEGVTEIDLGDISTSLDVRGARDANGSVNISNDGHGLYTVTDTGRVLGPTIVGLYSQASEFCPRQGKEVSTTKLDQTDRRIGQPASAALRFRCVSASVRCTHLVPDGARVNLDTDDVILRDGTVIHYEPCSDKEQEREPPPP